MAAVIRVNGLSKRFGDLEVLRGIDCAVEDSEVVCVIGPSGSGKSTFLRCLNGLEEASGGEVHVGGVSVHHPKTDVDALRADIGMVFQRFNLFPHKTVLENITLAPGVVRGLAPHAAHERARALLKRVGLIDKIHAYPNQLSGGQQQRVAIARALATNPEIIYFDEPTSALDPELVGEVLDTIAAVATMGITMLIVTHEMHFAQEVSSKVVFMSNGEIVEEGTPDDIFRHPKNEKTQVFLQRMLKREEGK